MGKMLKYVIMGLGIYLALPYFVGMDKFGSFCYAAFLAVVFYFTSPTEPEQPSQQENNDDQTP